MQSHRSVIPKPLTGFRIKIRWVGSRARTQTQTDTDTHTLEVGWYDVVLVRIGSCTYLAVSVPYNSVTVM